MRSSVLSAPVVVVLVACANDPSEPPPIKDAKGRSCSRVEGDYRATCDVEPAATCFAGNRPCFELQPSGLVDVDGRIMVGALAICARCCAVDGDFAGGVNRNDCAAVVCETNADCAGERGITCKDGVCRK
jgi:hypothetical protein